MSKLKCFLTGAVCLPLSFLGAAASAGDLENAREMFADYRYAEGLIPLQRAAQAGDRQARRDLGLMLLYGENLYGPAIPRDHVQAKQWLRLARAEGCEVSRHVLAQQEKAQPSTGH